MFEPEPIAATDDVEVVPTPKRVRARLADRTVADTVDAAVLRERGRIPDYLIPADDIDRSVLRKTARTMKDDRKGEAVVFDLRTDGRRVEGGAIRYVDPAPGLEALEGYVRLDFHAIDAWFEEDEEIDVHPRDPRHRIDVRPSSRHVTLRLGGETVARSTRPTVLFETGLRPRHYMPRTDVRWEFLEPSDTRTGCPYKGWASYHHVRVGDEFVEDAVWSYRYPRAGAIRIANLMCFYGSRMGGFEVEVRPSA